MKCPLSLVSLLLLGVLGSSTAQAQSLAAQQSRVDADTSRGSAQDLYVLSTQGQSVFYGGVPAGKASAEVLQLSLADALQRALRSNLALLLSQQDVRLAQGARRRAFADLLPNFTAATSETEQQINLAALGFSGFPGIPQIIGPFSVFDTRVFLTQPILDLKARNRAKAEEENLKAAEHSYKDTRDLVVLLSGSLYLQAAAGKSRINAVRAQLQTAQALLDLALDRREAGVAAGIDVLRARVQLQSQQQRLIAAENDFAKEKLALARAIGLAEGQQFALADDIPYIPLPLTSKEDALDLAYKNRGDYLSELNRLSAAQAQRKAAQGEGLPSAQLDANYGDAGRKPWSSHGTFSVAATVRIPIFEGGRVRGSVMEAEARLRSQQAKLEDTRARIYYEIQATFLDLKAADDRVQVARSALDLAQEEINEIKDRFSAGVANTVEVVQGQESLATASDNYISSLYTYNLAKGALARAMGVAEDSYQRFIRGK
ncbi:MAG TPA: TolC family protein [Acidobacteriota bacterium]|nr:TolC family protein [Acidobacteriota bacterium]